jgi:hypothetical protein
MDGLFAGKDQIPVGPGKAAYEGWEKQRQESFFNMVRSAESK